MNVEGVTEYIGVSETARELWPAAPHIGYHWLMCKLVADELKPDAVFHANGRGHGFTMLFNVARIPELQTRFMNEYNS